MTSQWMQMSNSSNGPDKCWCARICEKKKKKREKGKKSMYVSITFIFKNKDETLNIPYPYQLMYICWNSSSLLCHSCIMTGTV